MAKPYPWRLTHDPWAVLVSEVMLQQTQIKTVLGADTYQQILSAPSALNLCPPHAHYLVSDDASAISNQPAPHHFPEFSDTDSKPGHYHRFMSLFPTPKALARASEQEVLKAWEGLGYYRRARNLHATAKAITDHHGGVFPRDYDSILSLPGIGRYTAGAVASFAFNAPYPIVDANVARVFSRVFDYRERIDTSAGQRQLWQWAEKLLDHNAPRSYNSAIMELGQSHCSNASPNCHDCPIVSFCQTETPESLPIKKASAKTTKTQEFAIFCLSDDKKSILLEQKQAGQRREGMWTLPRRKYREVFKLQHRIKTTYSITRYSVTLSVFDANKIPSELSQNEQWFPLDKIDQVPMPSPDRRVLNKLIG